MIFYNKYYPKKLQDPQFDKYLIFPDGKVYDTIREVFVQSYLTETGYSRLTLTSNEKGKKIQAYVHRLVALAFIPNPDNKPEINHINGNPLNNYVDNLEWCTHRENQIHAVETGLRTDQLISNLQAHEVCRKLCSDDSIKTIAHKLGISETAVNAIKSGENRKDISSMYSLPEVQDYKAVLTNEQIHEVCKLLSKGYTVKQIVEATGISTSSVKKIKHRITFTHISSQYKF